MRPRVLVRQRAALDSEEAFTWYEDQRPGLGSRFRSDLEYTLDRIAENPVQFPVVERTTRRALLRTFPYRVYFDLSADRVIILAVVHQRRHPDTWKRRPNR